MKSLFTALLFLSILSSALPRNINVKDDASDAYVDALLANLRDYIASTPGLDPADLPEGEVSFSQEVGFITFHGSARVYDGFFRGLSTIHVCIIHSYLSKEKFENWLKYFWHSLFFTK